MYVFPATHYVAGPERMERAIRGHRARAGRPAGRAGAAGQAARGPAAADAHHLRHRDDAPGRVVLRHRELLAAHRRPGPGIRAELPARLLPRGLPARHRRVARDRAADRRDVRGRHVPQAEARRPRVPAAAARWTTARCGGRSSSTGSARPSTCRRRPGPYELAKADGVVEQIIRPTGLVDPEIVAQADEGPDRRPAPRDPRAGRRKNERVLVTTLTKKMAEDLTDYLLEQGHPGPLPALRGRHPAPGRAAARAADGRVRRPRRHQPAPRGPRPARGVAGEHPRRRQGGLPALGRSR